MRLFLLSAALVSTAAFVAASCTPGKRNSSRTNHWLGAFKETLLSETKAVRGLYKTNKPQFCLPHEKFAEEYHIKETGFFERDPLTSDLWGYLCLEKTGEFARLHIKPNGQAVAVAQRVKIGLKEGDPNAMVYEIIAPSSDAMKVIEPRLAVVQVFTGVVERFFDYQARKVYAVSLRNPSLEQNEPVPGFSLYRSVLNPLVVNESWHLVRDDKVKNETTGKEEKVEVPLANIWTNPLWGNWGVADRRAHVKQDLDVRVLYMIPMVEELRRLSRRLAQQSGKEVRNARQEEAPADKNAGKNPAGEGESAPEAKAPAAQAPTTQKPASGNGAGGKTDTTLSGSR